MENIKEINKKVLEGATLISVKAMLEKADVALTSSGKKYLNLTFRDKTGEMIVKQWDADETVKANYKVNSVYLLENLACNIFNDAPSYTLKTSSKCKELPDENVGDYCNDFTPDTDDLKKVIQYYVDQLTGHYHDLVMKAFNEQLEDPDDFYIWPAAENMHHNKAGGLAFHTAMMLRSADALCKIYGKTYGINRQLVLTATLLHDFFKTTEYELNEDGTGKLTDAALEGGHIQLCCDYIRDAEKEGVIDREESKMLRHMILAHHGEFGPALPATKEAMILHYVDMIDSRMYMYQAGTMEMEDGEYASKKNFGVGTRLYKTTLKSE